jgi:hypothetical protein
MEKQDAEGKRVMFIEEVQSDWHQKGRDQGYAAIPSEEERAAAIKEVSEAAAELKAARAEAMDTAVDLDLVPEHVRHAAVERTKLDIVNEALQKAALNDKLHIKVRQRAAETFERVSKASLRVIEANQKESAYRTGIPNAPFKSSWPALVMKRAIRWAVDNGYDKVAWTTGEEQAGRYNLAQATGPLSIHKTNTDGEYFVRMNDSAKRQLVRNGLAKQQGVGDEALATNAVIMTPAQMKEAFGAEIANRLVSNVDAIDIEEGSRVHREALRVRNNAQQELIDFQRERGDRRFVDESVNERLRDMQGRLNELTRETAQTSQYGWYKLEGEGLNVGGEGMKAFYDRNLVNITNDIIKKYGGKVGPVDVNMKDTVKRKISIGESAVTRTEDRTPNLATKNGFTITPQLREAASSGFPLFQPRTGAPVSDADAQKIATETAKLLKQLIPGDRIALQFAKTLHAEGATKLNGSYFMRVITLALDAQNPTWVLSHEALHAMKSMGLFTPTEWNLLVRNAWTNDPKMQERVRRGWAHQDLTEEQLQEEAVAEYFGEHVSMLQGADPDAPPQLAVRILRRIMNVIAAVLKAYRKVVGQPTGSIEAYQLAEKMRTGKIGARPEGFGEAARDRAARGPATVTFGKKGEGPRFQAAPGPLGINDNAEPRLVAPIRALLGADTADKLGDALDHFRYTLQDRMLPVLRTQAKIERMLGRKLEDNENPYLAEELYHGRTGAALDRLTNDLVEPLFEGMRDKNVTPEELETYLYARHAKERNARIQSINPEFTEGGSGMTDEEADAILADVDASPKGDDVKELAKLVDKMLAFAVKTRVDSGLLSADEAAAWKNAYQHYVPLRGRPGDLDSEGQAARINRQSGLSVKGKESRRAFGRKSKAADIIAYSMLQAEEAIVRAEQNEVAKAFLDLAKAAPDKSFWQVNKVRMVPVQNRTTGQVFYRAESRIAAEDAPYTVSAKVDGKEYRVTLNRDDASAAKTAAAMRNLDIQQFNFVVKTFGAVNRFMSKINTTYSPEFVISNAFRDLQTAGINLAGTDVKGLEA